MYMYMDVYLPAVQISHLAFLLHIFLLACVCVYIYINMYIYTHPNLYIYKYAYIYTPKFICIQIHMNFCLPPPSHNPLDLCVHVYIHI